MFQLVYVARYLSTMSRDKRTVSVVGSDLRGDIYRAVRQRAHKNRVTVT